MHGRQSVRYRHLVTALTGGEAAPAAAGAADAGWSWNAPISHVSIVSVARRQLGYRVRSRAMSGRIRILARSARWPQIGRAHV